MLVVKSLAQPGYALQRSSGVCRAAVGGVPLNAALGVMREYAGFFEWKKRDLKELGVVEELLRALNKGTEFALHSPRIQRPDPPDCACLDRHGRCIGIEVVEAVCDEAARRNAAGESVTRVWRPGEFSWHVRELLEAKDKKTYLGGPYHEIWVCVFTDEPMLSVEQARNEVEHEVFGPLSQISRAFLLMSYDSASRSYPVYHLNLRQ